MHPHFYYYPFQEDFSELSPEERKQRESYWKYHPNFQKNVEDRERQQEQLQNYRRQLNRRLTPNEIYMQQNRAIPDHTPDWNLNQLIQDIMNEVGTHDNVNFWRWLLESQAIQLHQDCPKAQLLHRSIQQVINYKKESGLSTLNFICLMVYTAMSCWNDRFSMRTWGEMHQRMAQSLENGIQIVKNYPDWFQDNVGRFFEPQSQSQPQSQPQSQQLPMGQLSTQPQLHGNHD